MKKAKCNIVYFLARYSLTVNIRFIEQTQNKINVGKPSISQPKWKLRSFCSDSNEILFLQTSCTLQCFSERLLLLKDTLEQKGHHSICVTWLYPPCRYKCDEHWTRTESTSTCSVFSKPVNHQITTCFYLCLVSFLNSLKKPKNFFEEFVESNLE